MQKGTKTTTYSLDWDTVLRTMQFIVQRLKEK